MITMHANGIDLALQEYGSGAPLILVHAFAHSRATWAEVSAGLAQRCHVIAYDQRGHGDSTHTGDPADYTIDLLVDDLAAVVAASGPDPVHLLGHSLGGLVALRYAAVRPDRVRSLILVNTSAAPTGSLPAAVRDRLVERGRDHGMAAVARFLDRLGDLGRRTRPALARERFRAGVARMDVAAFAALGAELDEFTPVSAPGLTVPVTLVCGQHDDIALAEAPALLATLPAAELAVVPDAGHVAHQDNPDGWLSAVGAHLNRTEPVSTVVERFATAAGRTPDALAVVAGDVELTYRELAGRVRRLRSGLAALGVRPGDTVGVCVDRSADLVALLLGILAAGAAYVPLDGRHPERRLHVMADDAGVSCVVSTSDHRRLWLGRTFPVVTPDDLLAVTTPSLPPAVSPDGLAYLMFTSGSTGRPKAVEVTHANLAHFLDAVLALLPPQAPRRVLFSTRLSFDIAGLELFLPLTTGGACLVTPDTWLLRARRLAALITELRPTLVQATPVGWRLLLDRGLRLSADQTALCGGDVLPEPLAARLAALPAPVFNMYGPTEATIWATAWSVTDGPVRIGTPLGHATVHVLDDTLTPVRPGTEGELYIGGPAVAAGYRGRPELTADRFVPDPWAPGSPMYATGDIVRVTDGGLEFLRRKDTQVKINGHRVELGEIETVAARVDGVRAAVAVVAPTERPELRLYVEAADPDVCAVVDTVLRETLPAAMVPSRIDVVAALPVTANGKVDRLALTAGTAEPRR